MWYAANQQIQSYGLRGDDNILKVNIILPGELMRDEAVSYTHLMVFDLLKFWAFSSTIMTSL